MYVTLIGNYTTNPGTGDNKAAVWDELRYFENSQLRYEKVNYLPSDKGGYTSLISNNEQEAFNKRLKEKSNNRITIPINGNIDNCFKNVYNNLDVSQLEEILGNSIVNYAIKYRLKVDQAIIGAASNKTAVNTSANDIIANLGAFFKQSAYVYTTETKTTDEGGEKTKITGWRASKLSVTGALLYGIFIFQSCMYLIMYVKRLFYVIMLSMFGPIVVIYDFFMKSAS